MNISGERESKEVKLIKISNKDVFVMKWLLVAQCTSVTCLSDKFLFENAFSLKKMITNITAVKNPT